MERALRAVGYHTSEAHGIVYIRDDIAGEYPDDRSGHFLQVSRDINGSIGSLDEMGRPMASLHLLEKGYVIQFHRGGGHVIFLAIDRDVGRQLSRFIEDCLDKLE